MSDTNRVGLRIAKSSDTTFPITTPSALNSLRITGTPNLAFEPQTIVSNEIRPDRQVSNLIPVGAEAGGDVGFELSFGTFDDLIESALFSSWINSGSNDVASATATTIVVSSGADFKDGHMIRVLNPNEDLGHGVFEVTNVLSDTLTITPFDANTTAPTTALTAGTVKIVGYTGQDDGDIDTVLSGNTGQLTIVAGNFDNLMNATTGLVAGQWIKISGADANNNVWARLTDVTTNTLSFLAPSGFTAQAGTNIVIWFGDYVVNGSEALSNHEYIVERRFEDHNPVTRELFVGMLVNQFNLEAQPQAIMVGTATFFGQSAEVSDDSAGNYSDIYTTNPASIDQSAPDTDVYNTSSNVGRIGRGANPVDAAGNNFVTQASMNINNNLRRQNAVGVFGAAGVGVGEFSVTGDLNAYFDNKALLEQVLNGSDTSFDMTVVSNDQRTLTFDLPRIRFSGGAPQVPGKNDDVTINLTYQAILDDVLNHTMLVQRGYYQA